MIKIEEVCHCENMWENRLGFKIHPHTWKNLFNHQKETKLVEIQWKILHNIFPTNILLNRMGLKESEKCDFCQEKDFVEHAFIKCKRLHNLWEKVNKDISIKLNKTIFLSEKVILLGVEQEITGLSDTEVKFINTVITITKFAIIKSKMTKMNTFQILDHELILRKIEL